MNHLHDPHVHNKRTSINELLNPVGATAASSSLPPSYNHQQLPSLSAALQYPLPHGPPPYPHPSSSQLNQAPFSLRAASWESGKEELGPRRSDSDPASCRYPPPAALVSHPAYSDGYPRPPRPDEAPHYAVDGPQQWSPTHETPGAQYGPPPMMPPAYPDERQGACAPLAAPRITQPTPSSRPAPPGESMARSKFSP